MSRFAGIILAAGMSRRLGRPKQLLKLDDAPVIQHVVRRALASLLDDVVVVVGAYGDEVRDALGGEPVRFVVNERFEEGQGTSLAAGVSALGPDIDAAVVLLGDQPQIDPSVIARVIEARKETGASIVMAQYGDERGHPVLFSHNHFLALAELDGDTGGREIVRKHAQDVITVPVERGSALADIDTDDDWHALQDQWRAE